MAQNDALPLNSQGVELLLKHVAALQSERDLLARHVDQLLADKKLRPTNSASTASLSDASTTAAEVEAWDMRSRVNALVHAIASTCSLDDSPPAHLVDTSPEDMSCWAVESIRRAVAEAEESALRATLQGVARNVSGSTQALKTRQVFATQLTEAVRAISDAHSTFLASASTL